MDESDDTLQSIEIPDHSKCPGCLWARESTVVTPNYIGFVKLYVTGSEHNADVLVDAQLRCQEGREHCMPCCVINVDTTNETCIPVMSISNHELSIKAHERLARAEVFHLNEELMWDEKPSCSATQPHPSANVNFKTGSSVPPEHCGETRSTHRGVSRLFCGQRFRDWPQKCHGNED